MTTTQGNWVQSVITYPTGLVENSADDLHTAVYVAGSLEGNPVLQARFTDNYTSTQTVKDSFSRIGYSFVIAIISTVLAYMLGLPIGLWMALKKDKPHRFSKGPSRGGIFGCGLGKPRGRV